MSDECVVVVRLKAGDDILAIVTGLTDTAIMIEYPYFARYNPKDRSVVMVPYCPLSDEYYFEISRDRIEFFVTANKDVTQKFLEMIGDNHAESHTTTTTTSIVKH